MPATVLRSGQIRDDGILREDLNTTIASSAVIRKIIAGAGISFSSTGIDTGTGDVTITATGTGGGMAATDRLVKQFLTDTGLPAGSNAMNVDGSSTPVDFFLPDDGSVDTFISEVILVLEDASVDFKSFGGLAALTTGFDLKFEQAGTTKTLIDKAKTSYELIRACGNPFDLISKINAGNDEALIIHIPLEGIVLKTGTPDEIRATVNDDLTGLIRFTALGLVRSISP